MNELGMCMGQCLHLTHQSTSRSLPTTRRKSIENANKPCSYTMLLYFICTNAPWTGFFSSHEKEAYFKWLYKVTILEIRSILGDEFDSDLDY